MIGLRTTLLAFFAWGVVTTAGPAFAQLRKDITIGTPTPTADLCNNDDEFTVPNPLPGGNWVVETRFYDQDEKRPERPSGRSEGQFGIEGCGMAGSWETGYNEVIVTVRRNGLGVVVEVDQIRK
jgi:hypothetical protein